ncbi:MAG: amidohydrolase [Candidatus Nanohaloarchaea archaeon]
MAGEHREKVLRNCRYIFTQDPERKVLEDKDIRIKDGEIAEIGEELEGEEVLDCSDRAVFPGLINLHTHVAMTVLRGISDNKRLEDWLEEDIFPAEEKLGEEEVRNGAELGIAEMLKTGTTCFNDMYFHCDAIADAVRQTGIRAVISYGLADMEDDIQDQLKKCEDFIEENADEDRITPAVGPHAVYTCSPELLKGARKIADEYAVPYHIHLSETQKENQDCIDENGSTPTEHLEELGLLGPDVVAAHGVWLTEEDMDILEERGVGIAHNPAANLKLGSGIAEIDELGGRLQVGIGTDGPASNNSLDMLEEGKIASLLQKLDDPETLTEQEVLDMMTVNAAEILGMEDRTGSIEEGKKADLFTVELGQVAMTPHYGPRGVLSDLVFSGPEVAETMVGGEILYRDGEFSSIDGEKVMEEVQDLSDRLS